ncbi:nucleotidyltransferase family protein [Pelagibacterium sp.]|uniref:nucleotidyltransferase family protein n=1 Tax=Pelagibacterium sp. TaxID=1967288 RepID=UPI003BACC5F7
MTDHLRYAGASPGDQQAALKALVRANGGLTGVLQVLRATALPQALVGGGAVYQTVWNALTGRPTWYGVKDIDVIYFDDADLSYEAEDAVIKRVGGLLLGAPVPVEIRNQARVHLWFGAKFGFDVPPLKSSAEALTRYASRTHAVAVALDEHGDVEIDAPFGLEDLFAFRVTPNRLGRSRQAHNEKGERIKTVWPEVDFVPWS